MVPGLRSVLKWTRTWRKLTVRPRAPRREGRHDCSKRTGRHVDHHRADRSFASGRSAGRTLGKRRVRRAGAVRVGGPGRDLPRLRLAALRDGPSDRSEQRRALPVPRGAADGDAARRLPVEPRLDGRHRSLLGPDRQHAPHRAVAGPVPDHQTPHQLQLEGAEPRDPNVHLEERGVAAARASKAGRSRRVDQLSLDAGLGICLGCTSAARSRTTTISSRFRWIVRATTTPASS